MAGAFASEDELEEASPIELRRGTRLGRYELLLPIARGGMARVWAARQHGQRGFTKLVAIKTILPHLAREGEFERMFLDEARIASLVHHPNVCEIYELGDDQGVLYLAMEWVSGDSLMHVLRVSKRVEPIDLRVAARIVADGAAGIHAAHELTDDDNRPMNVVHRDVSPHNILITADGHIKVADFGVAKALGQMHSATIAGQIKGKIAYMAPEQITSTKIDRRSDIFSLGCILYEATTGLQPFLGDSDPQVMHAIMRGDYVPPSKLMVGYPRDLEMIIVRALAPDPNERFATADQVKLALEQWLAVSGPIVTTSHVAGVVRERLGAVLDKRREKIRDASQSQSGESMIGLTPAGAAAVGGSGPGVGPGAPTVPPPTPGSTSGVRPHQEQPRQLSNPNFPPYAGPDASYPGVGAPAPGHGSGPGNSVIPPPFEPLHPHAQGATSHGVGESALPFNPSMSLYGTTNYGAANYPGPQPSAPSSGRWMNYFIAIGIGVAVALAVTIVVVLLLSVTKHPVPAAPPAQRVSVVVPPAASLPIASATATATESATESAPAVTATSTKISIPDKPATKPPPATHHEASHRPMPVQVSPDSN